MKSYVVALSIFAITSNVALSKETVIHCPTEYPDDSVKLISPPSGWAALLNAPLLLHDAGVMEGPMDVRGITKPEPVRSYKGRYDDYYVGLGGFGLHEKWVWCGYSGSNDLLLVQPLAKEIKQCVVTHHRQGLDRAFKVSYITCR